MTEDHIDAVKKERDELANRLINRSVIMSNVAYMVHDDYEGCSEIIFHNHGLAARRIGANILNVEFEDVSCKRAKQYDSYASNGTVPAKVLIEDGWHFECHHCGTYVCCDGPIEPVFEGDRTVFCGQSCKDAYEYKVKKTNKQGEKFIEAIKAKRPDLDFVRITAGWPFLSCHADFMFPGCKYGGSVKILKGEDLNLEWTVANGDLGAWNEYEIRRKSEAGKDHATR